MKPEAVPIAQKPRHIAYYLQKPLKQWLDQGIEEDIYIRESVIRRTSHVVLTTCCSTKAEIQKDTKRAIAAKYE
jgi:hypothetical protein